jgi:hypothetical protein
MALLKTDLPLVFALLQGIVHTGFRAFGAFVDEFSCCSAFGGRSLRADGGAGAGAGDDPD